MFRHDIVVIGGSAGGLQALRSLVSRLPDNLQPAVFVVLHNSPHHRSKLPELLNRAGKLPAAHAVDKELIRRARIYVAPPDYHMVLEADHIRITKGPKENRFRPAVDPLFRSAAYVFGTRVIGIILSGALDDGTAGLWAIKDRGGIAIVQDPEEAEQPSMPSSAKENVQIDHCLEVAKIADALPNLIGQLAVKEKDFPVSNALKIETSVALGKNALGANVMQLGSPSIFTCPECHGALVQITNGNLTRFRCHTGHSFSMRSLLAGVTESTGDAIWNALRAVEESILLLEHISRHAEQANSHELAQLAMDKMKEAEKQAHTIRLAALSQDTADIDFTPDRLRNDRTTGA